MHQAKQGGWWDPALFVAVLTMTAGVGLADQTEAVSSAELPPTVRTLVVSSTPDTQERQFYGRVAARETVDLAFEVGGLMVNLLPEEGTLVAKGAKLAGLDLDPFQRAVDRAELALSQAERDAERARALLESAAGPEARALDAATARDLAEVALRDARASLSDATLTSPFNALVAARLTPAHSIVAPGQPILRLHDMSEVRVEIDVPERLFIAVGGLAGMTFTAAGPDGTALPLRLVAFQPDPGRVGQSYRVTLVFMTDPGASLLPGASVTVTATVPTTGGGVVVPQTALVAQNDRSAAVLVLDGAGDLATLRSVPVTISAPQGDRLLIDGLPPGSEIVALGAHRLAPGQTVRRFTDLRVTEN